MNLVKPLPGEVQIQLHALVGLLDAAHLVGFIGGQEIARCLRG
jgi:hypothetical protein